MVDLAPPLKLALLPDSDLARNPRGSVWLRDCDGDRDCVFHCQYFIAATAYKYNHNDLGKLISSILPTNCANNVRDPSRLRNNWSVKLPFEPLHIGMAYFCLTVAQKVGIAVGSAVAGCILAGGLFYIWGIYIQASIGVNVHVQM
ncbi:hypothetical protein X797_006535 [Metarhizium robertsii]|uniref:Uncharacterized protein n=1 Tax=Metarhizium robertsii TaxID=568076 RepID=A0A014PRJ1_9HYPO|nr:hypothetical protein X797_006535 [Metarhizium robertsii]